MSRRTMAVRNEYHGSLLVIRFSQEPTLQQCDKASGLPEDSIQYNPEAITDEFAYYSGSENLEQYTYRWPFCEYKNRTEMPLRPGGRWDVLNDSFSLFYPYDPHEARRTVRVVSSDGRVLFQSANGKHEYAGTLWTPTRSNELGTRIAVDVVTLRGGNRVLDLASHPTARRIAVYDIELQKELASIPASSKYHYPFEFGFDLSPDGHHLAVLENGTLNVIDLDGNHMGIGSKLPAGGHK